MSYDFPVPAPYDATNYPTVERYDADASEPADWKLTIAFESAEILPLTAVCAGHLSAVPPWEMADDTLLLLHDPAAVTDPITLYLEPLFEADTLAINNELQAAGFGSELRYFVYENVDPATLSTPVTTAISNHWKVAGLAAAKRRDAFARGEIAVSVTAGAQFALAQFASGTSGNYRMRFGIVTSSGMIDPIAFFWHMSDRLSASATTHLASFVSFVSTDWPFLASAAAPTAADMITAATTQLYPAAVLYDAKHRIPLTDDEWRDVGDGQKALYKTRLRNNAQDPATTPAFGFHRQDMVNPFQLEAVTEFFMRWPEPETTELPDENAANQTVVDLQSGDWNLVIIDPFNHARLGSPALPGPEYWLASHHLSTQAAKPGASFGACHTVNGQDDPPGPDYNPDTYQAVLFLVHHGQVKAWFRWGTYSGHQYEDEAKGDCAVASSIKGNVLHDFESFTAGSRPYINYAFLIWSQPSLRTHARYYFRSDTPVDADGKGGIFLHMGVTANRTANEPWNGAAGCLVSPSFPLFRNRIIALYQEDYRASHDDTPDPDITPIEGSDHATCRSIYLGTTLPDGVRYTGGSKWDGKISGSCWVIRPDEPTRK